jgi:glycosyltransferase involved in cell wall biosynthesis
VLVPASDGAAYTRALAALLADAPRRQRLGEQARATVRARFLFERRLERMTELYRKLALPVGP